jgi:lysophospholipase
MPLPEFDAVLENSFNIVSQGNGTLSENWAQCLGCAAIDRSLGLLGIERPQVCENCWDGTLTGGVLDDFVLDPTMAVAPNVSYTEWSAEYPDF